MKISLEELSKFVSLVLDTEVEVIKKNEKVIVYKKMNGKRNYNLRLHTALVLALNKLEKSTSHNIYFNISVDIFSIRVGKLFFKSNIWLDVVYLALMTIVVPEVENNEE